MKQSDREKIAEYLRRAEQADRSAGNADNPNIAEQWRLIAGTWRTMADAISDELTRAKRLPQT